MTPAPIDTLVPRLEEVVEKPNHQYKALCPAHDDHHPSLSIKELDDGRLLIHCWAGCSSMEIVEAAGLGLADLFPNKMEHSKPVNPRWNLRDLIEVQNLEAWVLLIAVEQLLDGKPISQSDRERCWLAIRMCQHIKEVIVG